MSRRHGTVSRLRLTLVTCPRCAILRIGHGRPDLIDLRHQAERVVGVLPARDRRRARAPRLRADRPASRAEGGARRARARARPTSATCCSRTSTSTTRAPPGRSSASTPGCACTSPRSARRTSSTRAGSRRARAASTASFDLLWGELAPVPEENVEVVGDRVVGLECFPSPGHASHHVCYLHADGTLYAGDAAGVRIQPGRYVLPVSPPPDLDVEAWFRTFEEIERRQPERLALTHFGVADSPSEHLALVREPSSRGGRARERRSTRRRGSRPRARPRRRGRRGRGRALGAGRPALAVLRRDEAVLGQAARSGRLGPLAATRVPPALRRPGVSFLGNAMAPSRSRSRSST